MSDGAVAYSRFLQVKYELEQWREIAERMFLVAHLNGASSEELLPFFQVKEHLASMFDLKND